MRTTLDVDDDVLSAAKELAKARKSTVGQVLSDLARQTLTRRASTDFENGIPQLPADPDAGVVTMERVNRLRDESP